MHNPICCRALIVLVLLRAGTACGVGGIGQNTGGPVQPTSGSQQQPSAQTGNTTGAITVTGSATGGVGATTTDTATTGAATTAGDATTGAATGSLTGVPVATTTGDAPPPSEDGNAKLFDTATLNQAVCLYDITKKSFALTFSNDAQYCAHSGQNVRISQSHVLSVTGKLNKSATQPVLTADSNTAPPANNAANPVSPNNPNASPAPTNPVQTLAQPTDVQATLSLYSATCALVSEAMAVSGSVTFTQANFAGCSGSYTFSFGQTIPPVGGSPVTLNGTFRNAPLCAALGAPAVTSICR